MYSKLIIRVDNQEVIFHAHEVVKIAMDFHETFEATREEISDNLIQSLEEHLEEEFDIFSRSLLKAYGNKYNINPDQLKQFLDQIYDISLNAPSSILYVFSSWTEVLDYIKSKKAEDPNFEGFLTKQVTRNFLPIPPPIAGINKIEKWRGISCFLREASKKPPLLGWWFLVAGRLIHINNNEWHKIQLILEVELPKRLENCPVPAILSKPSGDFDLIINREGIEKIRAPQGYDLAKLRIFFDENKREDKKNIWLHRDHEIIQWIVLQGGHRSQHFYVSDHGPLEDVYRQVEAITSEHSLRDGSRNWAVYEFYKFYENLDKPNQEQLKLNFIKLINQHQYDIHDHEIMQCLCVSLGYPRHMREHIMQTRSFRRPSMVGIPEDGPPHSLIDAIDPSEIEEAIKRYKDVFETTLERVRYQAEVRISNYYKNLFRGAFNVFRTQLENVFSKKDAEIYFECELLTHLTKEVGCGDRRILFRSVASYGNRYAGSTYQTFEKDFQNYFEKSYAFSDAELACIMRKIMRGDTQNVNNFSFIPNLMVAWFVAEQLRNPLSLLSGLMLLDMIENNVTLIDEAGNNWYAWINTLIHPQRRTETKKVKDLYGHAVRVDDFGGSHPMVHHGSVKDTQSALEPKKKLSVARQKEGNLILHWLYMRLKSDKAYSIDIYEARQHPFHPCPEYDEVSKHGGDSKDLIGILKKTKKLQGTIGAKRKNDPNAKVDKEEKDIEKLALDEKKLRLKQQLQREVLEPLLRERLSTLDNLLLLRRSDKEMTVAVGNRVKLDKIDRFSVVKSPLNPDYDRSSAVSSNNYRINVSGHGNNCGLFSLTLGLKRAFDKDAAKESSLQTDFVTFIRQYEQSDFTGITQKTDSLGQRLRRYIFEALTQDDTFKTGRYQNFLPFVVNYVTEQSRPQDMEAFQSSSQAFLLRVKNEWQALSPYLSMFNEDFGHNLSAVVSEREVVGFLARITQTMGDNTQNHAEAAKRFFEEHKADKSICFTLYQKAWARVGSEDGSEAARRIFNDTIRQCFRREMVDRLIAIPATEIERKVREACRFGFLEGVNFTGQLTTPSLEMMRENARSLLVESFVLPAWPAIYQRYIEYVRDEPVYLSADELGCLAKYWNVQLEINFGDDAQTSYRSYSELNANFLRVVLCNPSRGHWMVDETRVGDQLSDRMYTVQEPLETSVLQEIPTATNVPDAPTVAPAILMAFGNQRPSSTRTRTDLEEFQAQELARFGR